MKLRFSTNYPHRLCVATEKRELAPIWTWPILFLLSIGGIIYGCYGFVKFLLTSKPKSEKGK